jgi:glutamate racemase
LDQNSPIGVFDSGLGGLTVTRAIRSALPNESLIYLGDTARVPYGTRSAQTIIRYARICARHLSTHDIKFLVVACNTVSAVAVDVLRVELDIPVLGVIVPGARAGVRACGTGRIGVIATAGTVASGAYTRAVAAEGTRVEVIAQPAPLLVPLVEEGWLEGEVPRLAVRRYLEPLAQKDIGALVLGCTHFPLLRAVIETELHALAGKAVPVVDSAEATAAELASMLEARTLQTTRTTPGGLELVVTDTPRQFTEMASRFLGRDVAELSVRQVDL